MPLPDDELFAAAIEIEGFDFQKEFVLLNAASEVQQAIVIRLLERHHQLEANPDLLLLNRTEELLHSYSEDPDVLPGTTFGNFKVVERIGEGGMGVVYRAQQQQPMSRIVALKLLKPGMDTSRILGRFALERQILERLEHPGITRILDAGKQPNGRPWFAMDLVDDAIAITNHVRLEAMDIRDRIQLLIEVCDIVQHAHQKGVIHRDLKPSNLLITQKHGQPVAKVIDFGIAKVLGSEFEACNITTQVGEQIGTPAYMAPEYFQESRRSSIDVRVDVFSLGIVLAELLTGVLPGEILERNNIKSTVSETHQAFIPSEVLKTMSVDEVAMLAENCNTSAKNLHRLLTGELNWICSKAVAYDREDRYQTIGELKQDLNRFLEGLPVEAAKPSVIYRTKKLVARNPLTSVLLAASLATIISVAFIATWFAYLASASESRAVAAERKAKQRLEEVINTQQSLIAQRNRANEESRRANEASRKMAAQWRTRAVANAFTDAVGDYYRAMLETHRTLNEIEKSPFDSFDSERCFDTTFLSQPHQRLAIRGDWSWVCSRSENRMQLEHLRISSRDMAQIRQQRLAKPSAPLFENIEDLENAKLENARFHRARVRKHILENLANTLGSNDPLIAEALDNCGADALGNQEFTQAEQYFRKSVAIWNSDNSYPSHLAQSELLLAHCLRCQNKVDESREFHERAIGRIKLMKNEQDVLALAKLMDDLGLENN